LPARTSLLPEKEPNNYQDNYGNDGHDNANGHLGLLVKTTTAVLASNAIRGSR
jgi:hypothetical protein